MQCPQSAARRACSAKNAYNPTAALLSLLSPRPTSSCPELQRVVSSRAKTSMSEYLAARTRNHEVASKRLDIAALRKTQAGTGSGKKDAFEGQYPTDKVEPLSFIRKTNHRAALLRRIAGDSEVVHLKVETNGGEVSRKAPIKPDQWKAQIRDVMGVVHNLHKLHQSRLANRKDVSETANATQDSREPRERCVYRGRAILPQDSPPVRIATSSALPWALPPEQRRGLDGYEMLDEEIRRFVSWLEPTEAERAGRRAAIEQVRAFVESVPDRAYDVELVGSERSGLALSTSDIDFRVVPRSPHGTAVDHDPIVSNDIMHSLYRDMFVRSEFMAVNLRKGHFPIINAQHRQSGILIQLIGTNPTTPQLEVTKRLLQELPNLRSTYFVLRTAFEMRGFLDSFNGGMGSYTTLMLVAAVLIRKAPNTETGPTPLSTVDRPISPATCVMRVLGYYHHLDTNKRGLSVIPPKLLEKHSCSAEETAEHIEAARAAGDPVFAGQWAISRVNPIQPYLFCLQDPANPTNDLGARVHAIKHIFATTGHLRRIMRLKIPAVTVAAEQGKVTTQDSLLLPIVGNCHEVYATARYMLEEYGREQLTLGKNHAEAEIQQDPQREADVRRSANAATEMDDYLKTAEQTV